MGYEGQIFYGTTGSTAATQILNATDLAYNLDLEKGSTVVRGDGSAVPITTENPTVRTVTCEWTMINDTTDTTLAALIAAARACTSVAIRTKDYSSGTGFDGDCYLTAQHNMPLKGEQTYTFNATPNRNTRTPSLNA